MAGAEHIEERNVEREK